jgi:hypothetical protein
MILNALAKSDRPVHIVTTGSVRDVTAAFNRDPALFRQKVARIYVIAGNSSGGNLYWNPGLDPQAWIGLMNSDLPVYWAPCFGGPETLEDVAEGRLRVQTYQSYWVFRQADVFDALARPLQNYFLYALARLDPRSQDPIAYLDRAPDEELRKKFWPQKRNMWSVVAMFHLAGRELYRKDADWVLSKEPVRGYQRVPIYEFVPAKAAADNNLRSTFREDAAGPFRILKITDLTNYQTAMTVALRNLLTRQGRH